MGIRKYEIDTDNPQMLSDEAIIRLNALNDRPIDYSDIPRSTPEELRAGRLLAIEMRKKQMFSLRLKKTTIEWWKSLGEGYTSIMARLLDEATRHPEWVKKCL